MSQVFFSIQAIVLLDGKSIKCTAEFDDNGIKVYDGSKIVYHSRLSWKDVMVSFTQERVQTFLFFSSKRVGLQIRDNQIELPTIIIKQEQLQDTVLRIEKISTEYRSRYEQDELIRLRQEEIAAEEKRQRKLEEEHQRKLEEEELQRKLEEEERQRELEEEIGLSHFFSFDGHEQSNGWIQEHEECLEFQRFKDNFVRDSGDPRVEILAETLLDFLNDYINAKTNNHDKVTFKGECDKLITYLIQMDIDDFCNKALEDTVYNIIYGGIYYDPSYMRELFEDLLIEYNYRLRLSSGGYLLSYTEATGLKNVESDDPRYIESRSSKFAETLSALQREHDWELNLRQREIRLKEQIDTIVGFIEKQKRPVSIDSIKAQFPALSSSVIYGAVNHIDMIHLGRRIISSNNLVISKTEIDTLRRDILEILNSENRILHIKEFYDALAYKYNDMLTRLFIDNENSFYNVVKYLYDMDFSFNNPYLAKKGVVIPSPEARLRQYAEKGDEITIDELFGYAKANYIKVNGVLSFINSLNDKMLLKNREKLVLISKTGITASVAKEVEQHICNELDEADVVAIRDLKCISMMPTVNVSWDEWLIYSVLNKWGAMVSLYTTSHQFRSSIPVVSLNSFVSENELKKISSKHAGNIDRVLSSNVDDLNNLDELIEDIIDIEDIDELDDLELDLDDYDEGL